MTVALKLTDLQSARDSHNPLFIRLLNQLSTQPDPEPEQPIREGALTFDSVLAYFRSPEFKRKSRQEQMHDRQQKLRALEAPNAEVPLPDRLRSHELIFDLWKSPDPLARDTLLRVIAEVPLVYGPWKALKGIFKEAEAKNDLEVYAALAARFDQELANRTAGINSATLAYLARRGWRTLRRVAVQLPAIYADTAVEFMVRYTNEDTWQSTWILNHILFHETKLYGRYGFTFGYRSVPKPSDLKPRAFSDLWKRSPRPLFSLLERAKIDPIREFAAASLKADFRAALREVEPAWVIRLVAVPSVAVHDFVVWILQNVPKFEQSAFRTLGLHAPVLRLFDSPSQTARKYAADYARTHARDLSIDELILLANNSNEHVRKLAQDLLGERDPRKEVGLDAWGRLLETDHGHPYAAAVILKSFGAKELTPDWFADRLLSPSPSARAFAQHNLPKIHPREQLGSAFFVALARRINPEPFQQAELANYIVAELSQLDPNSIPTEDLRWLFLFPPTSEGMNGLFARAKNPLKPHTLGIDFLKALAFHPDWEASNWLADFRARNGQWAKELSFNEATSERWLSWFADVQTFSTRDLGIDWMLGLAGRSEPRYHQFAKERMIRTLAPADFAPSSDAAGPAAAPPTPTTSDLKQATFLFTGKLASMKRDEAEAKVKAANGLVSGSVTKNLHYLVIGDDGSPLYGQGSKGSKQLKAEDLNAAGANIAIISEAAFLQMVSGGGLLQAASADSALGGCQRLWSMAIAPGPVDAPLGVFAREYLRNHHPAIGQALTGRPVSKGSETPVEFFTFARVQPLLAETRRPLRELALELCRWEFARWNPPVDDLLVMSENPFVDVRRFVALALLSEPGPDSKTFRLDPASLSAASVYRFCESSDEETRGLGMELIRRLPKLRVPEELFRLTQSPDRKVRAFVIRSLWQVYRDRGLTLEWKPPKPPEPTLGAKAKKQAAQRAAEQGDGVPAKPETWPAEQPILAEFLRRVLFELPPGPPEKSKLATPGEETTTTDDEDGDEDPTPSGSQRVVSLKPIPARRAKLEAVEVMRDLALEEKPFAQGILPLLQEFMVSRGVSERAACLVAVTRIRHHYPDLATATA